MNGRLRDLREVLKTTEVKEVAPLITLIDEDLEHLRCVSVAVVGPSGPSLANLEEYVVRASPSSTVDRLPQYRSEVEWDAAISDRVYRASVVIAITTARQFQQDMLFRLLAMAHSGRVPVLLLVEGLGQMRDPKAHSVRLSEELVRIFPTAPPHLVFLGDNRFTGDAGSTAISRFLISESEDLDETETRRETRLIRRRATAAREIVLGETKRLQMLIAGMRAHSDTEEAMLRVLLSTGESLCAFWSNSVRDLIEAILTNKEQRVSSILTGDPCIELRAIHALWSDTFRVQFEAKIARYCSTAHRHIPEQANVLASELKASLMDIADGGCGDMGMACEECGAAIQRARGIREAVGLRTQAARNMAYESSTMSGGGNGLSVEGSAVDGSFSVAGMLTNLGLNSFAKRAVVEQLDQLEQTLQKLAGQCAAALEQEIRILVTAAFGRRRSQSPNDPKELEALEHKLARVTACLSKIGEF